MFSQQLTICFHKNEWINLVLKTPIRIWEILVRVSYESHFTFSYKFDNGFMPLLFKTWRWDFVASLLL